ncbi:unnamed protein product [Rotaria magnacalcarata]|uniref:Uncharacterized protein n=1 Tax=Rotaria magnacalcarata TaxID=392030 RepID=A0A816BNX5_9BILA|nr:unnamed protein product [Rotaria magnacalcarata]
MYPVFLLETYGTLLSSEDLSCWSVFTCASGSTNSMIGAAHLSGIKNGIVIDIGVIVNGRPRQTQTNSRLIDDIRVNIPVADTVSLPLGGGTIIHVNEKEHTVQVEPDSVAYRLDQEGLAFGGKTMTGTDIALAAALATGIGHCFAKLSSFIVEPTFDENGVWCIDSIDIEYIAYGTGILGSGGGGKYKMCVVSPSFFAASSDLIVGAGFMGAPTVSHELLPNGHECLEAVNVLEKYLSTNIAVKKDIFCIDGDAMGRAFPYLNQCLSSIHGLPATPSWLCDVRSGTIIGTDESISNSQELEAFFRKECTERGLCVGVAFPPIHGTAWS